MEANETMRLCYGTRQGKLCRMCALFYKGHCANTTGTAKCPPYGLACGKFQEKDNIA